MNYKVYKVFLIKIDSVLKHLQIIVQDKIKKQEIIDMKKMEQFKKFIL